VDGGGERFEKVSICTRARAANAQQPWHMDDTPTAGTDRPTSTALRAIWLLLVPTCCATAPWLVDAVASTDPMSGSMSSRSMVIEACLPAIGLFGVVGYGLVAAHPVRLWPFLPFALAAFSYLIALTIVASTDDRAGLLEGTTHWYPAAQFTALLCQPVQPFLALTGGRLAFVAVGRRFGGLVE
jgi:hypothetical protein